MGNYSDGGFIKPSSPADLLSKVSVDFAAGGKASQVALGSQDCNVDYFALPLLQLRKGDRITIKAFDRQIMTHAWISTVELVYSGTLPLRKDKGETKVRCRLVGRTALEKRLAVRLPLVDCALGQAKQNYHFDPQDEDLGGKDHSGRGGASEGKKAVAQLAGLVGWDDPRLRARVAFVTKLDRRYAQEMKTWFVARRRSLPGPGSWITVADGALALRVEKFRCGAAVVRRYHRGIEPSRRTDLKRVGCVLHLTARNQGLRPIRVADHGIGPLKALELISSGGMRFSARPVAVVASGKLRRLKGETMIAPSSSLEVVWVPSTLQIIPKSKLTPFMLRGAYNGRLIKVTTRGWTRLEGDRVGLRLLRVECGGEVYPRYASATDDYGQDQNWLRRSGCVLLIRVWIRRISLRLSQTVR